MKGQEKNNLALMLLPLFCIVLLGAGLGANALPYDYSASIECLAKPEKPQYGGGIIRNPEFKHGLRGWSSFGDAKLQHRSSVGNEFIVAHSRNHSYDSMSQKLVLHKDLLYTFSAWVQVSEESAQVTALFKTRTGFKHAGAVIAQSNCWSMLKGGLTVDASGPAQLFFESKNTSVEIWIDSISLQPFTQEQWRSHQDQSIDKTRKRNVKIQAVDTNGKPLVNAKISIRQKIMSFPFGCAINKNILSNQPYQDWFTQRFKFTTFENEMKWYSTEATQGREDYSVPDSMLQFTKQHGISVRGHNVLWDDPNFQPGWVKSLSPPQLADAAKKRLNSVMSRYKGQLIHWDVVNENLHFSFFEDKLGQTASADFYSMAHSADTSALMFLNDYNTLEESRDGLSSPAKYLEKLKNIQAAPGNQERMGIGLEGHFDATGPNIPYMRSSLDALGAAGVPIWITEVDVKASPQQAVFLEQILKEAHSHPKVSGIVMWSAWSPEGCYRMCLTDNNFKNLATGDVVDKLLKEWGGSVVEGTAGAEGSLEAALFLGDYEVRIDHPAVSNSSSVRSLKVDSSSLETFEQNGTWVLQVSA